MKRFIAMLLFFVLLVFTFPACAMLKYLDQEDEFRKMADEEKYDELIQAVKGFQQEHPLLMSDEWIEKISDVAIRARDAFVPEFNSEYDPFEDIELKWFGDHKVAGPDDPCVILDGTSGLVMSFCIPVDSWIYVDEFTALINGSERLQANVENWDNKIIDHQEYETFYVDIGYFNSTNVEAENYDSLAFRFYGRNKDEHVDIYIDEETMGYFKQVTAETVTSGDVKQVIWNWAQAVDDIVDETIIPAFAARMMKNNPVPIYPADIQTADFWKFKEDLRDDVLSGKWIYAKGDVFFFPCQIERVNISEEEGTYSHWSVYILSEYGKVRSFASILIPVNHPLENHPEKDDIVLVAATYSQKGNWGPIFFLGYEDDVIEEASTFSQ